MLGNFAHGQQIASHPRRLAPERRLRVAIRRLSRGAFRTAAGVFILVGLGGCLESGDVFGQVEVLAQEALDESVAADVQDVAVVAGRPSFVDDDVHAGEYALYDLGSTDAGDVWTVSPVGAQDATFVIALLDQDLTLVYRGYLATGVGCEHVIRTAAGLTLGVMPISGSEGGHCRFELTRTRVVEIPTPQPQVVWLNFEGASYLSLQGCSPITFGRFDGAIVGPAYADETATLKQAIIDVVREHYASFDVTITTSDDGPAPSDASVIHFGGAETGKLGRADAVDDYNRTVSQNAIVYVENFAPYGSLELDAYGMGVMIGDVASHELGHLLGLYHTLDPGDVMGTGGTAAEYARGRRFRRSALEPSVFAIGSQDPMMSLQMAVGKRSDAARTLSDTRAKSHAAHRPVVGPWIEAACATCGDCDR